MGLIVQKFGGSSVSNKEKIFNVAKIITDTQRAGNSVVVVVSAIGDTTDELIKKAKIINKNPSKRELDLLLSTGETASAAFLALAIQSMDYPAVALTGEQAGFETCDTFGNAKIRNLNSERILNEIKNGNIVVVAGFQGINKNGDVTTLGRGGSDASAIKIAASIGADECKIFTDVTGVFTSDPNVIKSAKKIKNLTFDEMIFMSFLGAQVMNTRAVQIAKKYNVGFEVLFNSNKIPGTVIGDDYKKIDNNVNLCGIVTDEHITKITVFNKKIDMKKLTSELMEIGIRPDMIKKQRSGDTSLIVNEIFVDETLKFIKKQQKNQDIAVDKNVVKVSLVGSNLENSTDIFEKFIEILNNNKTKIHYFVKDEHRISAIITKSNIDLNSLNLNLHNSFFD